MHDDFDKLLSENSISFTVLVNDAQELVLLREYFTSKEKTVPFQLPVGTLKGEIKFTGYIVVDKNINNFSPDYQKMKNFSLNRHMIYMQVKLLEYQTH